MSTSKNSAKDPCWEGYEKVGMKTKNGKLVPNCVPIKKGSKKAAAKKSSPKKAAAKKTSSKKSATKKTATKKTSS